jgi:hypothetical protein
MIEKQSRPKSISKNKGLDKKTKQILQDAILELKVQLNTVEYFDQLISKKVGIETNFKHHNLQKWLSSLKRLNDDFAQNMLEDYCEKGWEDKSEQAEKVYDFRKEKRKEYRVFALGDLECLKLHYKMVNQLMNKLFPIKLLGNEHFYSSGGNGKIGTREKRRKMQRKKLLAKVNKTGGIGNDGSMSIVKELMPNNDPKLLENLKTNLVVKMKESIINYHSNSKKRPNC